MPPKRRRIPNQAGAIDIDAARAPSGYTVDERLAIAVGIIRGLLRRTDIPIDGLTRERMELALRIVDSERGNDR